jgi:hypothetical protein
LKNKNKNKSIAGGEEEEMSRQRGIWVLEKNNKAAAAAPSCRAAPSVLRKLEEHVQCFQVVV